MMVILFITLCIKSGGDADPHSDSQNWFSHDYWTPLLYQIVKESIFFSENQAMEVYSHW